MLLVAVVLDFMFAASCIENFPLLAPGLLFLLSFYFYFGESTEHTSVQLKLLSACIPCCPSACLLFDKFFLWSIFLFSAFSLLLIYVVYLTHVTA